MMINLWATSSEEEALKAKNEKARREAFFIAYKENLILEKYSTQTIKKSSYAWSEEKRRNIEALVAKSKAYRSPVSAGVIHIKEKMIWVLIILILIALIVSNFFYTRPKKFSGKIKNP